MAISQTETKTKRLVNAEGEIIDEQTQVITHNLTFDEEPDYVKLYIQTISVFTQIKETTGRVFYELVKLMSYAEYEQLVFLNPVLRQRIQKNLNISQSTFDKSLRQLRDKDLIRRVANNTFSINPNYIGKGSWKNIKRLQAKFDFITGDVITDFAYNEDV